MHFRFALPEDVALLAQLNAALIQDEGHGNPMSTAQLAERMSDWLRSRYQAVLFLEDGSEQVVGYAVFRRAPDHVYLRQFFVAAAHRRKGIGRKALAWLWTHPWKDEPKLRVDVLTENLAGRAFWQAVGFRDYCLTMEMGRPAPGPQS